MLVGVGERAAAGLGGGGGDAGSIVPADGRGDERAVPGQQGAAGAGALLAALPLPLPLLLLLSTSISCPPQPSCLFCSARHALRLQVSQSVSRRRLLRQIQEIESRTDAQERALSRRGSSASSSRRSSSAGGSRSKGRARSAASSRSRQTVGSASSRPSTARTAGEMSTAGSVWSHASKVSDGSWFDYTVSKKTEEKTDFPRSQ